MATIYKIYCKNSEIKDLYVGSTIYFNKRINQHINRCNNENSKSYNLKVYKFIRENGGFDNFIIEKIIECDLENKYDKEVEYYLLLNSTLNTRFPKRSNKQYRIDNKERINEVRKQYRINNNEKIKQYYIDNKEHIADYSKQYRIDNKELFTERDKNNYINNRDKILETRKIKIHCDCGSIIRRGDISTHKKSKKHQNYLSTM